MVPSCHVQRGINSLFIQFRCRVILDRCRFSCGPLGTLGVVSVSEGKNQSTVPCAYFFADRCSSGHQASDANTTGMKTEPNA